MAVCLTEEIEVIFAEIFCYDDYEFVWEVKEWEAG